MRKAMTNAEKVKACRIRNGRIKNILLPVPLVAEMLMTLNPKERNKYIEFIGEGVVQAILDATDGFDADL